MSRRLLLVPIAVLCLSAFGVAGGPLLVGGPKFGANGQPFVWDNTRPIQYRTDGGNLGTLDNSTANSRVAAAFNAWASVPTAKLSFQRLGPLVGIADVVSISDFDQVQGTCENGTQTPVVYDADGSLFHQLFSDPNVVGFAGACALSADGKILTGSATLNGAADSSLLDATMVHEFGHMLGLDHTQLNCRASGCDAADNANIPTMFPVLFPSANPASPKTDDRAWISKLYPNSSYATSYGLITGRVLFSDGISPVQDAVVIARQVANSPAHIADQSPVVAVSGISGYRFTGNPGQPYSADYLPCNTQSSSCPNGYFGNNTDGSQYGSRDASLIGFYELPVPPGMYTLEVRTMNNGYTHNDTGPLRPSIDLPGPDEFWNAHESATDATMADPTFDVLTVLLDTVTVTAGATTSGIDFILNNTPPTSDDFESGPLSSALNDNSSHRWLRALSLSLLPSAGGAR